MKNEDQNLSANRGTFVAIALCIGLYLAWNQYLKTKYPGFGERRTATTTPQTAAPEAAPLASSPADNSALSKPAPQAPTVAKMVTQDLLYDTRDISFTFSQELGSPISAKLKNYRDHNSANSATVELLQRPGTVLAFPGTAPARTSAQNFSGQKIADGMAFSRIDGPWKIDQIWTLPKEGYVGRLTLSFTNNSGEARPLNAQVLTEVGANVEHSQSSFFAPGQPGDKPRFLTQFEGSDDFVTLEDFCKDQTKEVVSKNKKLDFFGFDTHYFAFALIPDHAASYRTVYSGRGSQTAPLCEIVTLGSVDMGLIAPGAAASLKYDLWFGPKDVELIGAFNPRLKTTLGLGWLDMIAQPLLLAIKGLYKFTGNYGIAIIILTVLLKILFFPLTKQAAESAARMKKLNPEMTKIRERYKADPQKMQMELMKFMGTHKINPMKGCLPILPTIPVFFALFRVLSASIDLRHAPFYGWITDLSAKDPFFVSPIVLTGCMFIQQRLTPMTGMDKNQERIMMFMPLIFGVMMITLPSGLVLYMLTNTIVSIFQQQYLNKKFANI